MAARIEPARVQAARQPLHPTAAEAGAAEVGWSGQTVLASISAQGLPSMTQANAVNACVTDDTGLPKKGSPSVGAARQHCGGPMMFTPARATSPSDAAGLGPRGLRGRHAVWVAAQQTVP